MINKLEEIKERRRRRKLRIRKKIFGTPERPRVTVYKSKKYFYAQAIDDTKGITLASISSIDKEMKNKFGQPLLKKMENVKILGEMFAERLKSKGIKKIAFDRNGYKYMGLVKVFADTLRQSGIEF